MNFVGDYHTHTKASDGTGTVKDNVLSAKRKGLEEVAITDHSFTCILCHMTRKKFWKQEDEIADFYRDNGDDVKILHGVEGNLLGFDGYMDVPEDIVKECDVLHLGFHRYLKIPVAFKYAKYVFTNGFASKKAKEKLRALNTQSYLKAMDKYPIDVLVHLGHRCPVDVPTICKKAAEKDIYVEFNEKHVDVLEQNIEAILLSGVKLIVGSDAHSSKRVGNLEKVSLFIEKYNIPKDRIYGLGVKPTFKVKNDRKQL